VSGLAETFSGLARQERRPGSAALTATSPWTTVLGRTGRDECQRSVSPRGSRRRAAWQVAEGTGYPGKKITTWTWYVDRAYAKGTKICAKFWQKIDGKYRTSGNACATVG